MDKVKTLTVREAVQLSFKSMPEIFYISDLVTHTRKILSRPDLMDATITRSIRKLRELGKISYNILEWKKGKYQKNIIGHQAKLGL